MNYFSRVIVFSFENASKDLYAFRLLHGLSSDSSSFLSLKKYYFCNKSLSFCKKDIDTFIYVLIISDFYY